MSTIPEDKVVEYIIRERVKREALRRLAAEEATTVTIPELKVFADMLLVEMAQTQYRIDNWQPVDSRVILSAQNKSGKTTMRDNLVRCLVDGAPWLGSATVEPVGTVTIIDNEMSERQALQWLKDQGIVSTSQINFVALRGKVSAFNIIDDHVRSRWADRLRGTDYLVFDCLRPSLDALGLDEQRDAGKFLGPFDELMTEAGIRESLIVHHMGHSSGRARGDSRLRDWPDVEWFLERKNGDDPSSERFVRAYGRDVDVPKGKLVFDAAIADYVGGGGRPYDPKDLPSYGFGPSAPGANEQAAAAMLGAEAQRRIRGEGLLEVNNPGRFAYDPKLLKGGKLEKVTGLVGAGLKGASGLMQAKEQADELAELRAELPDMSEADLRVIAAALKSKGVRY